MGRCPWDRSQRHGTEGLTEEEGDGKEANSEVWTLWFQDFACQAWVLLPQGEARFSALPQGGPVPSISAGRGPRCQHFRGPPVVPRGSSFPVL